MTEQDAQPGGEGKQLTSLLGDDRLVTDDGNHSIESEAIHYERFLSEGDGGEMDVGVGRSGEKVFLGFGVEHGGVSHSALGCYTPEEARKIGTVLQKVADIAEDPPKYEPKAPDTSFIRRLLG